MCGKVERHERDRLREEGDRVAAIAGARHLRRAFAKRLDRGGLIFERRLRACEADVRLAITVLGDELEVGPLRLTKLAGGEELRRGVARELVAAAGLRTSSVTLAPRERVRELRRPVRSHETDGVLADRFGE